MSQSVTTTIPNAKRWRLPGMAGAAALAIALTLAVAPVASAATLTNSWKAKVGTGGANGVATLNTFTTGTGSLVLKLAKLKPSSLLAVTLLKGSCSGAAFLTLASVKSTSAGAVAKTVALTAAQAAKIRAAGAAGRIAFRIGAGTTKKCGVLAAQPVPAYLAATISLAPLAGGVAIAPTGIWVADYLDATLTRIDPATNTVLSSINVGADAEVLGPDLLVYSEGAFWVGVTEYDPTAFTKTGVSIRRIDSTGQQVATIKAGSEITDIAASPGAIWVTSYDDGTLTRIDTASNQVAATVNTGKGTSGVTFGEGSVWVSNETSGAVLRIDPATNQVIATIPTVGLPEGLADGAGAIWVTNWGTTGQPDGVLSRIDPITNQVTQAITVGTNPLWVVYGGGSLWVSLDGEAAVVRVNAATKAVQKISTGAPILDKDGKAVGLYRIAASDHAAWVDQWFAAPDATTPAPASKLFRINF